MTVAYAVDFAAFLCSKFMYTASLTMLFVEVNYYLPVTVKLIFLLLFRFELGIEPGSDPSSTYHIGQVIKCRITSSTPSSKRISLSFVMKPARFDSIYLILR